MDLYYLNTVAITNTYNVAPQHITLEVLPRYFDISCQFTKAYPNVLINHLYF